MLCLAGMIGFEPMNAGVWSSRVVLPHLSHLYTVRVLTPRRKSRALPLGYTPIYLSESTSYYLTFCDPVINGAITIYTHYFTVTTKNNRQDDQS